MTSGILKRIKIKEYKTIRFDAILKNKDQIVKKKVMPKL